MSDYGQMVNKQYGRDKLSEQIIATLQQAGKDINNLSRQDLSTFDEFHIGGVVETRNLIGRVPELKPRSRVLDVGSGLGGPARTLADEFDCEVVGLDLTEAYCQAATTLTELVGLSDRIRFQHGNALDMPFEDRQFDIVWTQFAAMNIEDKQRLYEQIYRVLKTDGYFVFHEVFAGDHDELIFPVFWADDDSVNHLRQPDFIRETLNTVGFEEVAWVDLTQHSTEWFEKMIHNPPQPADQPRLGFHVFVGAETPLKAKNIITNLQEKRITVYQGVYRANGRAEM